ncbi:sensor histidine kinase [Saccharothrix coeruleofusca]|uniref:histidine kinase n=1 Tax=Saccharothrix coeruleofusca TaxID=33919 RepID=A0A918AQ12_9PSEU|nr:histidine kinase [Saccharothrix coeruleofusca]GGP69380.1 two-component sensor histidine kinase [Saccharothrix coeruleofusca]
MPTKYRLDAGLAVLVAAVQLWPFFARGFTYSWWGCAVVVASAVPVVWRRRFPVTALIASLVATSLYDFVGKVPDQPVWYGGIVAMHAVAARSSARARIAAFAVSVGGVLLAVGSSETALRAVTLLGAAYALGRATAAAEERAARLERERELEAERAAERERARIARDMHDILSHAVSVMVVQAEAGPVVLHADPARAEAAFDAIAAAGRDAMVQLRGILAVLKEDDGPRAPQPTIDDLAALVEQVRGAGVDVRRTTTGDPVPLRPDVAVAAYRITQEALTNVVKHAAPARADVHFDWREDSLVISIVDDGPGAAARGARARGSGARGAGRGLIGIRERAVACGGSAVLGPRPDRRGFRVLVELPA